MTEVELHAHLKRFDERQRPLRKYFLSVDSPRGNSGVWLCDLDDACRLCATVIHAEIATLIYLHHFVESGVEIPIYEFTRGRVL